MTSEIQSISGVLTGLILLFAAFAKAWRFPWFIAVLNKYRLTPQVASGGIAAIVLALELVIGAALLFRWWLPWSGYSALGLFAVFTGAVAVNLLRGRFTLDCGCGSMWRKTKIGWHLVLRNLGLAGLTLLAIGGSNHFFSSSYAYIAAFGLSVSLVMIPLIPQRACH